MEDEHGNKVKDNRYIDCKSEEYNSMGSLEYESSSHQKMARGRKNYDRRSYHGALLSQQQLQ